MYTGLYIGLFRVLGCSCYGLAISGLRVLVFSGVRDLGHNDIGFSLGGLLREGLMYTWRFRDGLGPLGFRVSRLTEWQVSADLRIIEPPKP